MINAMRYLFARTREPARPVRERPHPGERGKAVVSAMTDKLVGPGTFLKLPFMASDLAKPLTTDLSADSCSSSAGSGFRANADRPLHCRLGGEPSIVGGESVLSAGGGSPPLAMFTGQSAPQRPRPGTTFGAGCTVGQRGLAVPLLDLAALRGWDERLRQVPTDPRSDRAGSRACASRSPP